MTKIELTNPMYYLKGNEMFKTQKMKMATGMLIVFAMFVAGCNTIDGMGKDIEAGGEKIQDAAD